MGHSVVRTESRQNHFHSSEISPKRGTTFSRQRQFTSNKINELIHVRQRIVLKMGLRIGSNMTERSGSSLSLFNCRCHPRMVWRIALQAVRLTAGEKFT